MQRQDGCWWFGQPGRCGVWNGIIVVFILVSVIDLFLLLIMALGGNEKSRVSARMQRYPSHHRTRTFPVV